MEDYRLGVHAMRVEDAIKKLGSVVLKSPSQDPVWGRYLKFVDSLSDWRVVCQKYDGDYREYSEARSLLQPLLVTETGRDLTPEEEKIADRQQAILPHLRFDIRCFYIFAKIAYVAFFGLLTGMAEDKSSDWKQARRFAKRIRRTDANALLKEFERQFHDDVEWFLHHVNFYRDDCIEHPAGLPRFPGLITSGMGAQIAGLTGRGLSGADEALLIKIQDGLKDSFPDFAETAGYERYEWVVKNKEKVPENQRDEVNQMVRGVGLQTPPLAETATKVASTLTGFLSFFGAWLHTRRTS